jgi:hypothetical protein
VREFLRPPLLRFSRERPIETRHSPSLHAFARGVSLPPAGRGRIFPQRRHRRAGPCSNLRTPNVHEFERFLCDFTGSFTAGLLAMAGILLLTTPLAACLKLVIRIE